MELEKLSQLEDLKSVSSKTESGVLIFKHSTRCAISNMVLSRFTRAWDISPDILPVYFLDLLKHRDISNAISSEFEVEHESPQILLIQNGVCVYHASHNAILPEQVQRHLV